MGYKERLLQKFVGFVVLQVREVLMSNHVKSRALPKALDDSDLFRTLPWALV